MGETFTHYARRVIARLDRDRLTVKQAGAEVRPLRENPDMQAVRDQALRDAAYRIRAEWVCCTTEDEGPDPARWPHECCRYSEYAAGNTEDLLGTPHGFDVTR